MDRKDFLELASAASQGDHRARARFIALALAAGFVSGPGGWVRYAGERNVCQGWAALAKRASQSGWVLTRFIEAGTVTNAAEVTRALLAGDEDAIQAMADELTPGGTVEPAGLEMPGMWEDADVMGGQDKVRGPAEPVKEYGLEVLAPVSGVHRVALTEELDGQVSRRLVVCHGDDALQEATEYMLRLKAGTLTPDQLWSEPKVHPGDVVTIHRGLRRYEVLRVELDAWKNGERCDYARVSPCDPGDERDAQWIAMDLLHQVEPVTTVNLVEMNGFQVSSELVDLGHHVATGTESRRVCLVKDPANGNGWAAILVPPAFPDGVNVRASAELPVLFPGDSVLIKAPMWSFPHVYRWMPDMGDQDNRLQDVTWMTRTREPVTS